MANESAVENISDLDATATCPGCGEEINLLVEHLRVTVTPARNVIETVDAALVGAEADEQGNMVALAVDVTQPQDDGGSRDRYYIGVKNGAGSVGYFHNYEHLGMWAEKQAGDEELQSGEQVRVRALTDDPQAAERSSE